MSYESLRKLVDEILAMKHVQSEALRRMLEYVAMRARCAPWGECWLETSGERLSCNEKGCWWEGT